MVAKRQLNRASVALLIASSTLLFGGSDGLTPSSGQRGHPRRNIHQSGKSNQRHTPRTVSVSRMDEQTTRPETSLFKEQPLLDGPSSLSVEDSMRDLSPSQIERLIVKLGRKGRINQALEVYEAIPNPVVRQVNAIIDACSRSRPIRLDLAFEILENSPVAPNVYTFGALMSVCARAPSVDHAVRLLKSMEEQYGVAPNSVVYNTAVSACGRADPPRPALALRLLKDAKERGLRMSSVGYNAAISAVAHAGDWQGAVDLLDQMEKSAEDNDSMVPAPDEVSYGTVLSAFEREQEWQRLLEYADYMHSKGIQLDGLAITSVLHACQSLGLADEAVRYLNMMKESEFLNIQRQTAGWKRPGGRKYFDGPDAVAYLLAVSACARGGAWLKGIELLDEYSRNDSIRVSSVDVLIFTAAIKGCEYEGRWEEAFLVLDNMRKRSVEPNSVAFAAVIGACATACSQIKQSDEGKDLNGPLKKAIRLFNVMRKDESILSPDVLVYNAAIRACAEAHDFKRAVKLYDAMELDGVSPNAFTFGALMTACERVGKTDGLNKVFSLMKQVAISPTNVIYGAAISCCRKAGDEERALLLLRKMVQEKVRPNVATFNTVLMAQAETRNKENLARVYKLMTSDDSLPIEPNRQSYAITIRAFADMKQPKEAETVLRHMRSKGFVPDVDLYTVIVSAYERTGQPLQALRLMESMNSEGYAFYEDKVLNAAFKRALKMANMVGRRLSTDDGEKPLSTLDADESDITGD